METGYGSLVQVILPLKVRSIFPIFHKGLFQVFTDLYWRKSKALPKWFSTIDRNEAGRLIIFADDKEILDALLRVPVTSKTWQDCKVVNLILISFLTYLSKHGVQFRWLLTSDGVWDSVPTKLIAIVNKAHTPLWKQFDALSEDLIALWEARMNFVGHFGKACDIVYG